MSLDQRTLKNIIKSKFNNECPLSDETKSIKDITDFALEETVRYIKDACILLECSFMTRTRALFLYHNFRSKTERKYDPYIVAAACISIAIKRNEEPIEYDAVILLFFRMLDQRSQNPYSKEFKKMRESLGIMEILILRMMEFSMTLTVAHEYLAYFMNDIREELSTENLWDVFSETCMKLACDFYLSCECLKYKAEDIAITVVQVSLYLMAIDAKAPNCIFKKRLQLLHDCPDKTWLIIEAIYEICDLGPFAESQRNMIN